MRVSWRLIAVLAAHSIAYLTALAAGLMMGGWWWLWLPAAVWLAIAAGTGVFIGREVARARRDER